MCGLSWLVRRMFGGCLYRKCEKERDWGVEREAGDALHVEEIHDTILENKSGSAVKHTPLFLRMGNGRLFCFVGRWWGRSEGMNVDHDILRSGRGNDGTGRFSRGDDVVGGGGK